MKNRPGGRCLGLPWLVATIAAVGSSAGEARAQIGNGACCFPDGTCAVVNIFSCTLAGGSFAGGPTCEGVVVVTPRHSSSPTYESGPGASSTRLAGSGRF